MAYVNRLWITTPTVTYIARNITTQTGHIYYTPTQTGTYYFNLSSNGVNVSSDQTTINGDCDNWLYTVPNPSSGGTFAIFYNYSGTQNGAIRFYDDSMTYLGKLNIPPESGGMLSYQFPEHGVYNIHLCSISEIGSTIVYNTLYPYVHCVQGLVVNHIETFNDVYATGIPFFISGEHSHLSKNVNVYFGSSFVGSVSNDERFRLEYTAFKSGSYTIYLRLETPDGQKILLDSTTVNIKDSSDFVDPPILPDLNPVVGYIIGTFVAIFFVLLPLFIIGGFHLTIDLPAIAFLMSGGVGVVLNIGLGLWDFWAGFFILALGVISIAGMYFLNQRG